MMERIGLTAIAVLCTVPAWAGYVPEPHPVKSAIEISALYFPGTPEMGEWRIVSRTNPERKPLLGWFDESNPEVIDWQIKWAVEHGISSFCVDWYWNKGQMRLDHWVRGYYRAQYRKYLKWYLMYANHNEPGSHSSQDQVAVTKFWIDNYFKTPEYLTISGMPVVVIWDRDNIDRDFISEAHESGEHLGPGEGVRRAFSISDRMVREAGFPGVYWIDMYHGERYDPERIAAAKEAGCRELMAYNFDFLAWNLAPEAGRFGDVVSCFNYDVVVKGIDKWWELTSRDPAFPFLPLIPTGWDSLPREFARNGRMIYERTPEKFGRICQAARRFCEKRGFRKVMIAPISEWQEGSYIEPNEEYGFGMYDALRDAFCERPAEGWPKNLRPEDVGCGPYDFPSFPRQSKTVWVFGHDAQGWWRNPYGAPELRIVDGVLKFPRKWAEHAMRTEVAPFRSRDFNRLKVRMRLTPNPQSAWCPKGLEEARIYWNGDRHPLLDGENRLVVSNSAATTVAVDGKWHDYSISFAGREEWSGMIDELWFSPVNLRDCECEIAWMKFAFEREERTITEDKFAMVAGDTAIGFRRSADGRRWDVVHLGATVNDLGNLGVMTSAYLDKGDSIGHPRPATYSTLGDEWSYEVNRYGGLAVRHSDGGISTSLVEEKTELLEEEGGVKHLVIHYRDELHPFMVRQHFLTIADCPVIETWIELENRESLPVGVSRMDSFAIDLPQLAEKYYVHHLTGQWAAEAQLVEREVGLGETVTIGSRSGVRDAWEGNPAVMVSIGEQAKENEGEVFGGVLCWSGVWDISVRNSQSGRLSIAAGASNSYGPYVLDPGKTLALPKFVFTYSRKGKGLVSRNFHDWARSRRLPHGGKDRSILLNSWEGSRFSFTEQTLTDMMDGVQELGGEMFVLDDGWFGRGKYARDEVHRDTAGLGDWVVNPRKLPHGLGALASEAAARGLKFGLWIEPEMANTNSWLYEAHGDWVLKERNRRIKVGRGGSQVVLDYTNPKVTENIWSQLSSLFDSLPRLDYVKWDANCDIDNLGSPYLDREHQANFPFDYTKGLYALLGRIRERYPDLVLQACSSGGGRADYGFLEFADEFWGSDDSDARERVFIQWGETMFYPASAIGAHVTASPNHQTRRSSPLKFRFDVAMSCRLGFELHPKNMSQEEKEFSKRCVNDYKRLRNVIQQGDLYRLVSPYDHPYSALMHVAKDRSRAVVFLYGLVRGRWSDFPAPLKLDGLCGTQRYRVREINRRADGKLHLPSGGLEVSGEALMRIGLPVILDGDYDSAVFELTVGGK